MYHVIIISENRILIKNIYEMIEDNSQLRIHIVPFSMDAYEEFYQDHADIDRAGEHHERHGHGGL